MRIIPVSQRQQQPRRISHLAANFDIDLFGNPEVSQRDGHYNIMDGGHRIEALKIWNGPGWEKMAVDCWVWQGLSDEDEAEIFLCLNDELQVNSFEKFKVAVTAGRPDEVDIKRIAEDEGLNISRDSVKGAVRSVGTCKKVYKRDGPENFRRSLVIIRDSLGDAGFKSPIIDGFAALCNRYNGSMRDADAVNSLSHIHGGVSGLISAAERLRAKTGNALSDCVAAAAVTIINRDRTGKSKLAPWWRE